MHDKKKKEAEIQEESIESTDNAATQQEPELEDIEENIDEKIKKLRAKLKSCEEEKASHLEELQRTKADYLNAKKRLETEKQQAQKRQADDFIRSLLPIYDSFKMAMDNQEIWEAVDSTWRSGVEGIFAQLHILFDEYEVTLVNTTGHAFDPSIHEAVGEEIVQDAADADTLRKVVQDGVLRNKGSESESLVRPARVIVGKFNQTNETE